MITGTTDEYLSASNADSSDLEFYDLSDDETSLAVNNTVNFDVVGNSATLLCSIINGL